MRLDLARTKVTHQGLTGFTGMKDLKKISVA
ncbi:MAG: hypothetical protein KatS3mg114_1258 [Planctomycetaceae bacterium]|nr:MAG: hypothetical protein KatS3mg114_1258 [Planctomycetaceae bacterium]